MISTKKPPMESINELTDLALAWLEVERWSVHDKRAYSSAPASTGYYLQEQIKKLNESRTLDPTGLTTFMMLRGLVESYLREVQISAYSLIFDSKLIDAQLHPMKELQAILGTPWVIRLIEDFQKRLREAAVQYGVRPGLPTEALEKVLADKVALAHLRRDALFSIHHALEAHQFTQGPGGGTPAKFTPQVFEFWNINSLLLAMRAQKVSGISLCLIRDPEEALRSYFVFAIRNGSTLTILTDHTDGPHPAHKRMTRRPDRQLSQRAARNWFPYQLLDLREQEGELGNGRVFANTRTSLVPVNVEAVPLKDIRDLEAEEFVWTILMFDLIREKFWDQNVRLPELSYTGEMVVEPQALVGSTGSLVKEKLYQSLELAPLKREDLTAEGTENQWECKPTGFNRWMVDRYGAGVSEEVFNLVGEQSKLLLKGTLGLKAGFEALDPTMFGTKEKIQRDRTWAARVNQMRVIQQLAEEEFEREGANISEWYLTHLKLNQEFLLDASARGELILPKWHPTRLHEGTESYVLDENVALNQQDTWGFYFPKFRLGVFDKGKAYCAEREAVKATVFTSIRPTCPEAIAVLVGMKPKDLPWALQHWYSQKPYVGNSILERLDPEDWVLKNPWMGMCFDVGIAHSKQAIRARRKKLGLP